MFAYYLFLRFNKVYYMYITYTIKKGHQSWTYSFTHLAVTQMLQYMHL